MSAGAYTRGAVGEPARLRFRQRDQFAQVARRHRRMHDQHIRLRGQYGDGRKILRRPIRQLVVEERIGGITECHHQQGMTIGIRLGDDLAANNAAGARTIVDHQRLTPAFRQFLRQHARQNIECATRCRGHDNAHGALREIGGVGSCAQKCNRDEQQFFQSRCSMNR